MKYLLIAYIAFANPQLIDEFEHSEQGYRECIHYQGENRWLYRDEAPNVYIVCLQSAEI